MSVEELKKRFLEYKKKKKPEKKKSTKKRKRYSARSIKKKKEMEERLKLIQREVYKYSSVSEMAKANGLKDHEVWYVINNNKDKFNDFKRGSRPSEEKEKYIPIVKEYYEGKGTLKGLAKKHGVSENSLSWYKRSLREELGYKQKKRGIPVSN